MLQKSLTRTVVHSYIFQINNPTPLWIHEATAEYLSRDLPWDEVVNIMEPVPTYEEFQTNDYNKFAEINGYRYSYFYAKYFIEKYGMEKWAPLIKTGNYEKSYEKDKKSLYEEWATCMKSDRSK